MRKSHLFPTSCLIAMLMAMFSVSVHAQLSDVTQPGDPIVGTSNNTPGSEGVANAIDNAPTKYLNFDRLNTGFTVTPRVGLSVVQCISLTSANDAPERDPASYTLEGSYDGSNFVAIAAGPVPAFTNRFDKVVIRIENNTPYLAYRLIFPTVVGPGGNSMQISEVELLGFLAPSDVTQPGDPIVATSNNSPGSEAVANAIDNAPTKYLNFDKVNTGFTVTPSVGPTLVSGITLTSANDAPDRDPASYRLEGSLDGVSFFEIASGAVPPFGTTRFLKNYIFFPNARAFLAYRLIFPTTAGNSTCCMQVSEVELLGVVSELAQDVTQPGDPIVASSNNSPGSEGVANAIDNAPTKYLNFDRLNTGFTVSPRSGLTVVNGLTLTSANDAPERDPATYTLAGSYDGSNFVQFANGSVPPFTNRFHKVTILVANKIPYLHYRLIFPEVVGPGGNSMQIAEVELLGTLAPTDVTVPGDPIVASSNNSPGSEGVANAIDNAPTKYLNFDKVNTGFTVTPGVGDTIVIGLTLTSANDAPDRDPASYTLEGSNDGAEYVSISSGAVPPFGTARFLKNYIFFTENTKSFKSYRLIFPTTAGNSTCCMQVAEVEFLGVTPGVVNTNAVDTLIRRQPQDTPVLLGSAATFRVGLTGPWSVQWYRNGVRIPGANNAAYTTAPATAGDDGARFQAVVQGRDGRQTSDEVMLSIFTPSTTESVSLSWQGSGANGAPTAMLQTDITGFQPQAYWNNLTGGSGGPTQPLNSSNQPQSTITVSWATSGEWGVGTGTDDPLERMLNGICTTTATTEAGASVVTFEGVPSGNHSVFLYTVQVPQEFFNMDFSVVTFNSDGTQRAIQKRYIRPLNSEEYNPAPGFSLVTADTAETRGVGNMMRFDNLQPGNGKIEIRFFSPGRVDLPGGDPIRGPGLNGLQLLLNPTPAGDPPVITRQPVSANGIAGGQVTLIVEATGPGLAYQWLKNGQEIAGATGPQLTLSSLEPNDAGSYVVIVSNPAGRVRSSTAVVGVPANANLSLGLVTYLKFDETDGAVAANSAPAGLPAEVRGFFPTWEPGQIASSLSGDGQTRVYLSSYPKPRQTMTVAGWVKSFGEGWGPLVNNWVEGRTTGDSGQFLAEVAIVDGLPVFRGQLEVGPNRVLAEAPIDGSLNVWHHFAMSANGVTLSLYWDGRLVGSIDYLGSINAGPFPWLSIGAELSADTSVDPLRTLFAGLDDIALWNRSLSDLEVLGVYRCGLGGISIAACPPVLNTNVNRLPVAVDDTGTAQPGVALVVNVLANDSDPDGNALTVSSVTAPAHGTAVINANNTVSYSSTGSYLGPDSFGYTIVDGQGGSASATVRITVVDTTPPVVTCPANITASTASATGATVNYVASATDAGGLASFNCVPPSGSTFPIGTTTVTCTAVDNSTNRSSCTFTVTVRLGNPNTPPTARITGYPLVDYSPNYTNPVLISCNGSFACMTLDGSTSSDAESPNSALTFRWFLDPYPLSISTSMVFSNFCIEICVPTITLTVVDPENEVGVSSLTLDVITASDAIDALIDKINDSVIYRRYKRPYIQTLKVAELLLARGQDPDWVAHGCTSPCWRIQQASEILSYFQFKIMAIIARDNPVEAACWIQWAQDIIDALDRCEECPPDDWDALDDWN